MHMKKLKSNSGFSLIAVMVALGITGLLINLINNSLSQQLKIVDYINFQSEKMDLKLALRSQIECLAIDCDTERSSLPSSLGKWGIRGVCDSTGLIVEVRKYNPSGQPFLHPLTKVPMNWENLYSGIGHICLYP